MAWTIYHENETSHVVTSCRKAGEKGAELKDWEILLSNLETGRNNPVRRIFLSMMCRMKDRAMRNAMHEAKKHMPIINLSNGAGYFIPDMNDETDIRLLVRYVQQEESRIRKTEEALTGAKKALRSCDIDLEEKKWQTEGCFQRRS